MKAKSTNFNVFEITSGTIEVLPEILIWYVLKVKLVVLKNQRRHATPRDWRVSEPHFYKKWLKSPISQNAWAGSKFWIKIRNRNKISRLRIYNNRLIGTCKNFQWNLGSTPTQSWIWLKIWQEHIKPIITIYHSTRNFMKISNFYSKF